MSDSLQPQGRPPSKSETRCPSRREDQEPVSLGASGAACCKKGCSLPTCTDDHLPFFHYPSGWKPHRWKSRKGKRWFSSFCEDLQSKGSKEDNVCGDLRKLELQSNGGLEGLEGWGGAKDSGASPPPIESWPCQGRSQMPFRCPHLTQPERRLMKQGDGEYRRRWGGGKWRKKWGFIPRASLLSCQVWTN